MIDKKWIGHELPPSVLHVDRTRLQFFAKAINETSQAYTDVSAARGAGYPDLPAPPTFLFAAEMDSGSTERLLEDMQIPLAKLLHGEQSFKYYKPVCAGDTVTVRSTISDVYDKKNGALEFIVKNSTAVNQDGERVAELRAVLVCRN